MENGMNTPSRAELADVLGSAVRRGAEDLASLLERCAWEAPEPPAAPLGSPPTQQRRP